MTATTVQRVRRKKAAAGKRLADAHIMRIAVRFARMARLKKRIEQRRGELQKSLLEQLHLRQVVTLQLEDVSITRAQQDPGISYDQEALLRDLKPRQRRAVIREAVDLNRLPLEQRLQIEATLTAAARSAITTSILDVVALKAEMQAGRIDAEIVERHTQKHERAPYVVVTGA